LPHATHEVPLHTLPGLHATPPQHGCETPPQTQLPVTHWRLLPHVDPRFSSGWWRRVMEQ